VCIEQILRYIYIEREKEKMTKVSSELDAVMKLRAEKQKAIVARRRELSTVEGQEAQQRSARAHADASIARYSIA
jgi:hypothetical protein